MKISLVIPAYNEERRISKTLEGYYDFFKNLKKQGVLDFEIIVVINNTTDRTENIVKEYSKKYKEIKYLNFKQGGKGFAIIEGFKEALNAKSDLIGFTDADMATGPEAFYWLIRDINSYDGAIASRSVKSSSVKMSLKRRITHKGFNFLTRSILFLPYRDTQCGSKIFTREAITSVINELGVTKWAFDIDLLFKLKKRGYKIKESPTTWEDKSGSKLNLIKVPFQMFSAIIRLRLIYSPFNFIVRLYNKLPEKIKIHNL
jgi:glycosyltransferase involved in cell wall biosynthesis